MLEERVVGLVWLVVGSGGYWAVTWEAGGSGVGVGSVAEPGKSLGLMETLESQPSTPSCGGQLAKLRIIRSQGERKTQVGLKSPKHLLES